MIKLIDILRESEDSPAKGKVLAYLQSRKDSTLSNTVENRLLKKLINDITSIDEAGLRDYVKDIFMNRKNTWKVRYMAGHLLDIIDGKK